MENNLNSIKLIYSRFPKDDIFDKYSRIVKNWKEYDKVSKNKMFDEIIKEYSNYNNIIDICTLKELKFLEMVINNDERINDIHNYIFERKNLINKMLLQPFQMTIPNEFENNVKLAIKNYDEKQVISKDKINEIFVGIIKIYGELPAIVLLEMIRPFVSCNVDELIEHIEKNKVFNYYIMSSKKEIESFQEEVLTFIYTDYFDYIDDLDYQRMNNAIAYNNEFDIRAYERLYRNTFYHDFDISNKKISKMINLIQTNHPYQYDFILREIQMCALLYEDSTHVIDMIRYSLSTNETNNNLNIEKIVNEALKEIPSGALNGLTPKDYLAKKANIINRKIEKGKKYIPQTNACLSSKDADLFYKLYFALLEYTNNLYNINTRIKKIYKQNGINPAYLIDIINKLWECSDEIINNFIKENPFKFNQEELEIINEFKTGKRDIYFVANYEPEYTAIISKEEKVYMVKGLRDNIDNIIDHSKLPLPIITTLLPFKGKIIFDGIINEFSLSFGQEFDDMIEETLNKNIKYYHF